MSQWWQSLEEGMQRDEPWRQQCWWEEPLKTKRSMTSSHNYTSLHRSGIVQLSYILCWAGALLPFTSPFIMGNSMGKKKPTQNRAAVIYKRDSVRKCPTGMIVVNAAFMSLAPVNPSVGHSSALPSLSAHLLRRRVSKLLMQNHAQLQPRNANSTSQKLVWVVLSHVWS